MKISFLGLDFLLNKREEVYFIEANSAPGGFYEYEKLYGNSKPLDELIKIIQKIENPRIALIWKRKYYEKYKKECDWKFKKFSRRMKAYLCFIEDQDSGFYLKDINGKKIKPNIVYTFSTKLKRNLKDKYILITPIEISLITRDKFLCYLIAKKCKMKTPQTFLIENKREIISIVNKRKKTFKNGFILKPRYGSFGKGVKVFNKLDEINREIWKNYILQQRIEVKKINGKFWDVRVFVLNGKYVGAIKRVSKNPIVNLSLGGKAQKVEKWIEEKVKGPSEKIARTIEKFAEQNKKLLNLK